MWNIIHGPVNYVFQILSPINYVFQILSPVNYVFQILSQYELKHMLRKGQKNILVVS